MRPPWIPLWEVHKFLADVCPALPKEKHLHKDEAYKEYYRQWYRLQRVADTRAKYKDYPSMFPKEVK